MPQSVSGEALERKLPRGSVFSGACVFWALAGLCDRRRLRLISGLSGRLSLKLVHAGIWRQGSAGFVCLPSRLMESSEALILTWSGPTILQHLQTGPYTAAVI